jgi:hypothetical protein
LIATWFLHRGNDNMARYPSWGPAFFGLALTLFGATSVSHAGSVASVGLPLDLGSMAPDSLLTLLTVHANPTEWGGVAWNGVTDVRSGNATPQSFTRTVADLRGLGINGRSFGIVFAGKETPGGLSVTLPKFSLQFFAADGTKLFTTAYQAAPGKDGIPTFGATNDTGWLYRVSLSQAEADLFYASDANRLGVLIDRANPVGSTSGGPESFSLLHFEIMCACDPQVPEPSSVLIWVLGTAGIWRVNRVRKSARTSKS